ncbi:endogenous retrovirus group K member 5 Gag polyprotein-like [Pithys albifrons albifrons]|uniref:endogenous retrovirus group K member 5 Gag polyprotein-like n=1 Tax=Pithys albifrons albifrons TaxID=3385563 RepID=UPI003A5CCF29
MTMRTGVASRDFSRRFLVPVAPGVEVPVLQNAGEVQEAAAAAEASNSATSTADARDSGCRPKMPRSTPLPPSGSSNSDSDDDIARKRRDQGSQIPSAPRYRPPPWAPPPPPPAGITDNMRALDFGNDVMIESGGGLLLRPRNGGNWSGIIRDALLEGDWAAVGALGSHCGFPVLQTTNPQGQAVGTHKPYEWKLLQQLRATVTQYQLHSEPVKQMLGYVFSAELLCPNDCMALAKLLCTPSQYVQWEKLWEEECRKVVNTPVPQGHALHGLQLDMLMGQGPYAATPRQLQFPAEFHRASAEAAHKALLCIPTEKKGPNWANVRQGERETYETFINRLVSALESDTDLQEGMRENLLKTFAFEHANGKTRLLLSTLPKEASLVDMLDRVSRAQAQQQNVFLAEAVGEAVKEQNKSITNMLQQLPMLMAVVTRPHPRKGDGRHKGNWVCFRCGKPGHVRKQCMAGLVWCTLCQSKSHAGEACRRSGNGIASANGGRAGTTVTPNAVNGALPPLSRASGLTWQQQ